jgi:hypothetical protein
MMQAILELNEFQKIIELPKMLPYVEMYYKEPGKVIPVIIDENNLSEYSTITMSKIIFEYSGTIGNFLLYKYRG